MDKAELTVESMEELEAELTVECSLEASESIFELPILERIIYWERQGQFHENELMKSYMKILRLSRLVSVPDENPGSQSSQSQTSQSSIRISVGPMTRTKAKEVQESMAGLIFKLRNQVHMEESKIEVNYLSLEARDISVDRKLLRSTETLQEFET